MIRGAFKRACLALEQGGTPLSTLMIESLKSDFTGTLRAVASFTPKELEIVTMPKRIEDMNDEQLEQVRSLALGVLDNYREGAEDSGQNELNSVH
jgi:hypothetical protein